MVFVSITGTAGVASHIGSVASTLFLSIECCIAVKFSLIMKSLQNEDFCYLLIPMLLQIAYKNKFDHVFRFTVTATAFRVVIVISLVTKTYSEPCETSKMERYSS